MKKVLTGNYCAATGVKLSRAQVIAAYPITPQSSISEKLAEMVSAGELNARFIKVESEHSAMAACIGAASTGARAFTATSSQGLALMHELIFWAAGARLPIVLVNVNRAMAPSWNIWSDQNDSLAERDTGWLQFYCENNQEVLDSIIMAYKISERLLLPTMVILDAFVLSHTSEGVEIPEQEKVDAFFFFFKPAISLIDNLPVTLSGMTGPDIYEEMRYKIQQAHREALEQVVPEVTEEFNETFGRFYPHLETYRADDAEYILVTSGTITGTSRTVVDHYREKGIRLGLLKIRMFRPFPFEEVADLLSGAKAVGVIDRNISFGSTGIFCQEVANALTFHSSKNSPILRGYIAGLGGRDVTMKTISDVVEDLLGADRPEAPIWIDLKR